MWRKRDGQRREKRGEGLRRGGAEDRKRGWDEGERCSERGSGVRDWKTEEARKLHSNQRQLGSGVFDIGPHMIGGVFSL